MSLSKKLLEQIDALGYGQKSGEEDKDDECQSGCCENCKKKKAMQENVNPIGRELANFNKRLSGMKLFRKGR